MEPFFTALAQANTLYDIDLDENEFAEIGIIAFNRIGNKRTKLYKYSTTIDPKTLSVQLPCNCLYVEAVTYNFEDWQFTTNRHDLGDLNSNFVEMYIEGNKHFSSPLYLSGKYAKYELVNDTLYFDKNYGKVNILYKGQLVDDEGLPMLTKKEIDTIALFVAFTVKYKEGLRTNNSNILSIAKDLQGQYIRSIDAARTPEHISQNDMNEILDAQVSWNRKSYGKSYKPIR